MSLSHDVWRQVKNLTADQLMSALKKDGWSCDTRGGSMHIFMSQGRQRRVSIHYHPGKTYGPKMLKALLSDIGWTDDDFRRLKLII